MSNGTTYYYVITSLDDAGNEGNTSVEASATPLAIPPGSATLTVVDGWDEKEEKWLGPEGKTDKLTHSDDSWWDTEADAYTTFVFSDVTIPAGATISSVKVFLEHWEEDEFRNGNLRWRIGTDWPDNPEVWATNDQIPTRYKNSERADVWDVTAFINTQAMAKGMELYLGNRDDNVKTNTGHVYVVVEWSGTNDPPPDVTPPAELAGLTATAGVSVVDLSWTGNTDGDLAGYHVYRSRTTGGAYIRIAEGVGVSSYADTTVVTDGTRYFYVVTTIDDSNNESSNSKEASAIPPTPPDVTPPAPLSLPDLQQSLHVGSTEPAVAPRPDAVGVQQPLPRPAPNRVGMHVK